MKNLDQQTEHLNAVFSDVVAYIYLAPFSNDTFNSMSAAQQKILSSLARSGPQKMSDLARQAAVTMSGATGVVDRLVAAGQVQRRNDPDDRRKILIELTTKGKRAVEQINSVHEKRLQEVLRELPAAERDDLVASFERIHQILIKLPQNSDVPDGAK